VIAAFPGEAQQLAAPAEFGQGTGSSNVAIPAYELEGVKFRVLFGFGAQGLNRIHLSAGKADDATGGLIEKALTDKHGAPAQRESTGTTLRGTQMTWKLPDQTIVLACAGEAALGFQSVTVDYLTPGAELPVATRYQPLIAASCRLPRHRRVADRDQAPLEGQDQPSRPPSV